MTWAFKRQISYILVLIVFFGVFGFLIVYPHFNVAPTCSDGKKNGEEAGVDCGGICALACTFAADSVSVLWSRSFMVVPGRYNAVAYLENHNKNLAVNKIKYSFRFADKDNIYLGKREGVISVPPGRSFAVFERGIELGTNPPVYTTFQFTEAPTWINVPQVKINQLQVFASDIKLENATTTPHLSATIKNNSLFSIPDVSVVAVLYDKDHNAVQASSTYLDELVSEQEQLVDFTWPVAFSREIVTMEVLPFYNIFSVKLK